MSKDEEDSTTATTTTTLAHASTSNHVYIASEDYGWIPARVLEQRDDGTVSVSVPQYATEAAIQSDGGKRATHFETQTVQLSAYPNHTLLLQNVDEQGQLKLVEDMVDLPFLHEAAILFNLKARHVQGKPYTRTGDIVIACNPYQWIHALYSTKTRRQYANALVWKTATTPSSALKQLPPHIYEVSAAAYRGLALDGQDQSILVSGESGAGKTESVKICLHHIASVQQGTAGQELDDAGATTTTTTTNTTATSSTSPIVQRVLDSNPLLEAFGNAQTIRNDNSSRFGKYIQLQFETEDVVDAVHAGHVTPSCVLAGSKCQVYLLEKSRVVQHEPDERTYHVFYQLLACPDNELKAEIWEGLVDTDCESFAYVGYSDLTSIEGVSDEERFQQTLESLALIGVTGDKKLTLFRALCIVLQLGNLLVEPHPDDPDNRSVIASEEELRDLADLMGSSTEDIIDIQQLQDAFCIRTMRARNEEFKVPLNVTQAKDSCHAFAKEIYAKTFLWLVRCINDATCAEQNYTPTTTTRSPTKRRPGGAAAAQQQPFGTIGLLDIFGFESFDTNRFEQLCINYANEKLQQKFTQDIFRSVQQEYQVEGIELGEIKYDDNTDVLDLVEGRMGLLAVLNEECVRPGGNDKAFVLKVTDHHKQSSPCLFRGKRFDAYQFGVHHYAGPVVYHAEGFVHKNMDTLPTDLAQCAKRSTNDILANHMDNDAMMNAVPGTAGSPRPKKKPPAARHTPGGSKGTAPKDSLKRSSSSSALVGQTVWTKFKGQLTTLMHNLSSTRTRYIRCIKPNGLKQPLLMQHKTTVEQLRCAGVVAAVTISRSAFPNRLEHATVLDRFKALWPSKALQVQAREHATAESHDDPNVLLKLLAEQLLQTAMRDLETSDGTRAFVMGHTRTYFRAGALEFLEAERLKRLGFWATDLQRTARGCVQRRRYQTLRRGMQALQTLHRRVAATQRYRLWRHTIVRLQCWWRCVAAQRLLHRLRHAHAATVIQTAWRRRVARTTYTGQRAAAVTMQACWRGALQRPKYRAALHQHLEEAKLENQVLALQRKLEEAEQARVAAEQAAEERARQAVQEYAEEKKDHEEKLQQRRQQQQEAEEKRKQEEEAAAERRREEEEAKKQQQEAAAPVTPQRQDAASQKTAEDAVATGSAKAAAAELDTPLRLQQQAQQSQQIAQQQTLIDESGKMLEYLRKEVYKLRHANATLKRDFDLLKDNNQRLMDANASAGASFAALNNHAKNLTRTNERLTAEMQASRQAQQRASIAQTELKEELRLKQASYVAEVHLRMQYQKGLNRVVELVERNGRDSRLVEQVLTVADECEHGGGGPSSQQSNGGSHNSLRHNPAGGPEGTDEENTTLMSSIRSFWS